MAFFLATNPSEFIRALVQEKQWFSAEKARDLDSMDPLKKTAELFSIADIIPLAGHSLGPVFRPVLSRIADIAALQLKFHDGHFHDSHPEGALSGHWFDCDRHQPSLQAVKELLGFSDDNAFVFTSSGLSQNLGILLDTFFRPNYKDWKNKKTKIVMLAGEFFSDQAAAISVLQRAIVTAKNFDCFTAQELPTPEQLLITIPAQESGLFDTNTIVDTIRQHAKTTQLICLSDIVFNTGQRLPLEDIFCQLADVIDENNIIVGLDLAHTVGNRKINLDALPVTFAVGCGYKHLSGFAGSGFGFYVRCDANLTKYPPLQGWKAADSERVFATIHRYDARIMETIGATAFRTSNPAPAALAPVQSFLSYFNELGFDACFAKSERLTQYLIAKLQYELGNYIEFVTPLDPDQRGAMIVFRIAALPNPKVIAEFLRNDALHLGRYEIDVRPPDVLRVTAHYGYTTFEQIYGFVKKLKAYIHQS